MTLHITPEILQHAYDYLRSTPPFRSWNMPEAEDVLFKVGRSHDTRGVYRLVDGKHTITISQRCIGRTSSLMEILAHEMIHLHEEATGMCRPGVEHTAAFHKIAARVCRIHGFDPKLF